jgi:AbiEi antitoxin C-terminal domain
MLCAMPVTVRIDGLGELLDQQLSVVSRGQLLSLGMNDNAMQYRVRPGGPWQVLLPGVYLGVTGAPNLLQQEMAALLYAGPGSLITGRVALMHHGLRSREVLETIDVLVPTTRQRRSTGFVRVHRTARMPSRMVATGPVRLVEVARAVADTARLLTEMRDVRAVVADAVQRGRCTVGDLAGELRNGPIRGSATLRSVLGEVAEGIRSTAEGDLRDLIRAARLPTPLYNASLYVDGVFLARPDAWWPEAGVAVEVDSYEWHLSPADADRTRKRHDLMGAAGIIPLHFSPRQIRRERSEVVRMIKDALASARTRSPLPIRTIPCPDSVGANQ